MRRMLTVLATAAGVVLLVTGVAAADNVTANFENPPFTPGTVDGQDGWKSAVPGDVPALPNGYDQEVVTNAGAPASFGLQSLRFSNRYTEPTGEFFYQTYSRPVTAPAGETQANREFIAEFSFISRTPATLQPGLAVSVSPDSNEGSRMSYVGLRDTAEGVRVTVYDTPEADGDFVAYDGGTLSRSAPHTIRFWMKTNPGPDNDLVRIFIDGRDLGQCFTTWENYYRTAPEQSPPPNRNTPATISSLQFRSSTPGFDGVGGGYLFDNVTTTSANGAGPPGCDVEIDKDADRSTVRAGTQVAYTITVRNRGRLAARNIRACDRIPRRTTFVRASRALRRIGRLRCLEIPRLGAGQRVSFGVVLQVDSDAPTGALDNVAEISPPRPAAPGIPAEPPRAGALPERVERATRVIARARAVVRVLRRVRAQRTSPRPPFTG